MAVNEIQRQAYLEAMGITSYFPRFVLPGAKASEPCHWPADTSTRQMLPASGPKPPLPGLGEGMGSVAASPVRRPDTSSLQESLTQAKARPEPSTVPAPKAESGLEIRFRLVFVRVSERLALINQLPHQGPPQMGAPQRQLLKNMLAAVQPDSARTWKESVFNWPLAQGLMLDNSLTAARESLQGFLETEMTGQPAEMLLVMGENLLAYLPGCDAGGEAPTGRVLQPETCPWQLLVTKNLEQILRLPAELKPDVWRDLRSLAAALLHERH